jgi:hypothetical protein
MANALLNGMTKVIQTLILEIYCDCILKSAIDSIKQIDVSARPNDTEVNIDASDVFFLRSSFQYNRRIAGAIANKYLSSKHEQANRVVRSLIMHALKAFHSPEQALQIETSSENGGNQAQGDLLYHSSLENILKPIEEPLTFLHEKAAVKAAKETSKDVATELYWAFVWDQRAEKANEIQDNAEGLVAVVDYNWFLHMLQIVRKMKRVSPSMNFTTGELKRTLTEWAARAFEKTFVRNGDTENLEVRKQEFAFDYGNRFDIRFPKARNTYTIVNHLGGWTLRYSGLAWASIRGFSNANVIEACNIMQKLLPGSVLEQLKRGHDPKAICESMRQIHTAESVGPNVEPALPKQKRTADEMASEKSKKNKAD